MSEFARSARPLIHERRRQHFAEVENSRPDQKAREVGREGLAKARAEIRKHRR